MHKFMQRFLRSESGATAIEYGLLASLVILAILVALQNLGYTVLTDLFDKVASAMT